MFVTYLRRELRGRIRQTFAISLGLALGIGLVITVSAVSAGLRDAQDTVLGSLYGVGSELTVTRAPSGGPPPTSPFPSASRGRSKSGPPEGSTSKQDTLFSRQLGSLPASSVASIAKLPGVTAAAGGLTLTDLQVSTVAPSASPDAGGGRGRPGQNRRPAPINTRMFGVDGVDLARPDIGPLSSTRITAGRTFAPADTSANVALLDSAYAQQQRRKVGSTITVAGAVLRVIGIVSRPEGSALSDVYIPLQRAQRLAGLASRVNVIYVAVTGAAEIDSLRRQISMLLPSATVTTSSDVAAAITGSLSTASSLADDLGRWLAIAVLAAAFLMASLLNMAAVSRRVREFGTLKALGWPCRRIIGQVMGEATVMGMIGGALGVALGYGGASLVNASAPALTASVGRSVGPAGQGAVRAATDTGEPVVVQLNAPVVPSVIVLAVALAVGARYFGSCHATCAYSWISPPSRPRRVILPAGGMTGGSADPSGEACPQSAATEPSSYCPLPALRPSCPAGGSCKPG
jgi:ABC-type antimicrobial peptide transport system permease subunit